MDRLIEIVRRVAFVTIWIIGGGVAVMFVLFRLHADTFLRQVMINLMALGYTFVIFIYRRNVDNEWHNISFLLLSALTLVSPIASEPIQR